MSDWQARVAKALEMAQYGSIDGAHHKLWTIDQMVRALTGCTLTDDPETSKESDEYREWVRSFCGGEDGPETYRWDTGIAP